MNNKEKYWLVKAALGGVASPVKTPAQQQPVPPPPADPTPASAGGAPPVQDPKAGQPPPSFAWDSPTIWEHGPGSEGSSTTTLPDQSA